MSSTVQNECHAACFKFLFTNTYFTDAPASDASRFFYCLRAPLYFSLYCISFFYVLFCFWLIMLCLDLWILLTIVLLDKQWHKEKSRHVIKYYWKNKERHLTCYVLTQYFYLLSCKSWRHNTIFYHNVNWYIWRFTKAINAVSIKLL